MTLENFRKLTRAFVPSAKKSVVPLSVLDLLINMGVDDVNIRAAAYQGDKKFAVLADTRTLLLSANIDDFAAFDSGGLWWNDGSASSPDWRKLDPYTQASLNGQFPRWRDENADNPLRYVQEGDNLQIDPIPNTALSDGFWAYYLKKAKWMTNAAHYPFSGSTTEITALTVLDDAIIDYVRWKLQHPLGKMQPGIITERTYDKSVAEKTFLLKRRFDISASGARMRGPNIE